MARDCHARTPSRDVRFTVRNGPGIDSDGLSGDDVVEGSVPFLVNAYGGEYALDWEPGRAASPKPVPTLT